MSSDFWFVDREGNQRGPVGKDEIISLIKDGAITRENLLWADGMDEWRAGGQVEAFASLFKPSPPPMPPKPRILRNLAMNYIVFPIIGVALGLGLYFLKDQKRQYIFDKFKSDVATAISTSANVPHDISGKLNIILTGTKPDTFTNGHATECSMTAHIHNLSKYHFDKVGFTVGDVDFNIDSINANSSVEDHIIKNGTLEDATPCSFYADSISKSVGDAVVSNCSIPSVAEGDCQKLVAISTNLNPIKVAALAAIEIGLGAKQIAPVHDALVAAQLDASNFSAYDSQKAGVYASLLDTIISVDSASWKLNKYIAGSMGRITLDRQSDGSDLVIRGAYRFHDMNNKIDDGWVKVKISKDDMPCLHYHDAFMGEDQCRYINWPAVSAEE